MTDGRRNLIDGIPVSEWFLRTTEGDTGRMETSYIREFLVLAECGSSYVAAERLFLSQSTLLRHIQSIEDEFGMPLFDRTRKGFVLNSQGQIFLPYAAQIGTLRDRCYTALHKGEMENQSVRLTAEGKIIDLMIDFRKSYPQYYLDYIKDGDPEEALYTGEIDVAFLTNLTPRRADCFQMIRYSREEVLVLLYEGHPLWDKESITMEELQGEKFVVLATDDTLDDQFYGRLDQNGTHPVIVASVPAGFDLIRMVREKMGIALIHGRGETVPPSPGLKTIPLNPPIEYDLNIYVRKDIPLNKASSAFVNFARKWIQVHADVNQSLLEGQSLQA